MQRKKLATLYHLFRENRLMFQMWILAVNPIFPCIFWFVVKRVCEPSLQAQECPSKLRQRQNNLRHSFKYSLMAAAAVARCSFVTPRCYAFCQQDIKWTNKQQAHLLSAPAQAMYSHNRRRVSWRKILHKRLLFSLKYAGSRSFLHWIYYTTQIFVAHLLLTFLVVKVFVYQFLTTTKNQQHMQEPTKYIPCLQLIF